MADHKKTWTQKDTFEFSEKVREMFDTLLAEYGEDEIYDKLSIVIVGLHPEASIDGEAVAAGMARFGKQQNVVDMAATIIKSTAISFSEDTGFPMDKALKAVLVGVTADVLGKEMIHGRKGKDGERGWDLYKE